MNLSALQKAQETLLGIGASIIGKMGSIKDPRNLALCSKVLKSLFMRGELTRQNACQRPGPYLDTLVAGLFRALHILAGESSKQCRDFAFLVLTLSYYSLPSVIP